MKQIRITATAFVLLVVSSSVTAETAYVTDRLLLGLYAEADSNSQQYRTLPSGTRLDILERQGLYARIITDDGLEGWVKYHFLVTEPPAGTVCGVVSTLKFVPSSIDHIRTKRRIRAQ